MLQEIDRQEHYQPQLIQEPVEGSSESGPKGNLPLKLLASARRHWVMVLLVWLFVGLPGGAAVWLLVEPTYTATGFVKVEPATAILFPEVDAQPQGSAFDAFLNTQAQEISSSSVLNAALADPTLKNVTQALSVESLRAALTVSVVPKTHLLRVGVKGQDPESAIRIAQAILRAYKLYAGGTAAEELKHKRQVLETERDRLRNALDLRQKELYTLARQYGATSETTIDALRETLARSSEEAHKEKTRAESEVIALEGQIEELGPDDTPATIWAMVTGFLPVGGKQPSAKHVPTTVPAEELALKEEMIQNDPTVKQLRETMASLVAREAQSGRTLSIQQAEARTKELLDKALAQATVEADRKINARAKQIRKDTRLHLTRQLQAAKQRAKTFEKQIAEREKTGLEMGQNGLEIKKLQDQLESIERDYKIIDQSLGKMDIENRRPDRITVDETAEILPGGVDNKRIKLLPVAVLGALFLGLGLAFLRDLISGRLYCGDDVEAGMGLRLLGSLPALEDLRRGRITEQDFRESYRAIRATLAGASPSGEIPRTLLITSAQAAEGKTSLAISLAASLAETGCRVLIIDGDVQAPRIAATLRLDLPFSLRHVLLGERSLAEAAGPTQVPSLEALLAGRNGSSAAGLLSHRLAAALIKSAAEHYDHVVIDSPPVLGSADALIWAQVVDGVLLSSFAGHSSLRIMRQACARVAAVGGRILGTVICNLSIRESYHSYSSYSSIHSRAGEGDAQAAQAGNSPRRLPYVLLPDSGPSDSQADAGAPGRA